MPSLLSRRGAEQLVNTETAGGQTLGNVALLADGGFVVVWTDGSGIGGDAAPTGIKAQRFDAAGDRVGSEFLVNSVTSGGQGLPTVAVLQSERFVATWVDFNDFSTTDGTDFQIKARIFAADGTPVAPEFLVNDPTSTQLLFPAITELSGGGFVIAWSGSDSSGSGVNAQIYDADGHEVGGQLVVNTTTLGLQGSPSLTALAGGGFVATWTGPTVITVVNGVSTTRGTVWSQVFDASGAKVGSEQQVNTDTLGAQNGTTVTALDSGYVVAWASGITGTYPKGTDIKIQLFDVGGSKVGGEILVNSVTAGTQSAAHVDRLPGGGFIVLWRGPSSSDGIGDIRAQVFDSAGSKVGVEFVLNGVTAGDQTSPKAIVLPSGEIAVVWTDSSGIGGDSASSGIKLQILEHAAGPTDISISNIVVSETHIENVTVATLSAAGALNTSFTYQIVSDSTGGAFRIDGDRLVVDDNHRLDFEAQPSVDVRIRATDLNGNSYEETLTLTVADAAIEARHAAGDEFQVNTDTFGFNGPRSVLTLATGGFVVVTEHSQIGFGNGLRGQVYDAAAQPVGGEFDIDVGDISNFGGPVSALAGGGFVMIFDASNPIGDGRWLRAQRFDGSGAETGGEIDIALISSPPGRSSVASLGSGGFVVIWEEWTDEGSTVFQSGETHLKARVIDASGTPIGAAFQVNISADGRQEWPEVASLPSGGFVATWSDEPSQSIKGRVFDALGNALGSEFAVPFGGPAVSIHEVRVLSTGDVLVTFAQILEDTGPITVYGIVGQRVDSSGAVVGDPIALAITTNWAHDVVALPDGGFALSWSLVNPVTLDENDTDSWVQLFNGSGEAVGYPFIASESTAEGEGPAHMAVLDSGALFLAWGRGYVENGAWTSEAAGRLFSPTHADIEGTSGNDVLFGTASSETLDGLAGNDSIVGDVGPDMMFGGFGNDVFFVDNAGDRVSEAAGEGSDRIVASASYVLAAGSEVEQIETISLGATDAIDLTGSDYANTIFGNAGNNRLDGWTGDDTLQGFGGDDYLVGGAGFDVMYGGAGNDRYFIGSDDGDRIFESTGEGYDTVSSAVDYTLPDVAEVERLEAGTLTATDPLVLGGSNLDNLIIGNAGDNRLRGFGGNDTLQGLDGDDYLIGDEGADVMYGGTGDDTYYVDTSDDRIFENEGEGTADRVATNVSLILPNEAEVEILEAVNLTGTSIAELGGSRYANAITGDAGNNLIRGFAGDDRLTGYLGDDVLIGDEGNDTMIGGAGNDVYYVDAAGDTVVEAAGEGSDRVSTLVSYALAAGAEVETLETASLGSTQAIDLTGSSSANLIVGNNGANVLDGKGGNDVLVGIDGADTFAFTTALGAGNVDRIDGFASGSDRIALDHAIFTAVAPGSLGAGAFVIAGSAQDGDDRIIYNAATGALLYDPDGTGAAAAVQFATLAGGPALAGSDFVLI